MSNASVAARAAIAGSASSTDRPGRRSDQTGGQPTERAAPHAWTTIDVGIMVLAAALALIPRTVNLLGLDPFIDEAAALDWPLRLYELTAPRTWLLSVFMDGRPPLYFWLLVPFSAVIDNGFLAGRLLAALADVLCVLALYALGRELASRTVGAAAAILWALSPLSIYFARLAVDDSLLTLMAVLTTLASVRLARQPTITTGALFGLSLGLTVLVKTNGALMAMTLPIAFFVLGRPSAWRTYVRPVGAAIGAGLLASAPLIIGLVPVLQQLALHTGSSGQAGGHLLMRNGGLAAGWMETLVGNRFLLVVGAGAVLALLLRQAGMVFAALLGIGLLVVILDVSSAIFARRLLLPAFPAFLLAGYAIERTAHLVTWGLRSVRPEGERLRLAVGVAVVALGIAVALSERADLAVTMVRSPAQARIPGSEYQQYVENWYAVYGLGQVADELRARGRDQPVTVLVPPASRENRVLVPYAALRYYLRQDPSVRFVEASALWRAQDLRELRRFTRDGPTYLVVNGTHTPASGMPNDAPEYTRQLERRLAQDFPDTEEVLRIPRPTQPNWLSLYRLDEEAGDRTQ